MKVAITTSSFAKFDPQPLDLLNHSGLELYLNPTGRKLKENEIEAVVRDADGIIAGTEPLTRTVLSGLTNLKVISRCGVGMDNVDIQAADEGGIEVYRTVGGVSAAVGELTIGLILNLLRKVSRMDRELRTGNWRKQMGNLLEGKKVGIVGFGSIGQKVGALLKGFNTERAYYDVKLQDTRVPYKDLDALIAWADIITLHCSAGAGDKPLIGESEIACMSKGSWLVNAARGGVVDEAALVTALKNGHLAGAAIDVFDEEPYQGGLAHLENVIVTPHIGSYAVEDRIRMELMSVENLLKGLGLKEPG